MSEENKEKEKDAPQKNEGTEEKKAPETKAPEENSKPEDKIEALQHDIENLKVDLENAKKEASDWKNKYYLAYADMANVRKDVERENADFKKYAKQSVIEEFIPVMDSFDMALKNEPTDPTIRKYLEGFQMIHNKLLNAFTQMGVTIIDPKKGEEFNPHQMEAFTAIEGEEDNKVADTYLKGYKLHDHLLRAAGVIITKKKEEKKEEPKDGSGTEGKTEEKSDASEQGKKDN